MTDKPMTVIAQIKISRANIEEAKNELKKLATQTKKEPGCIFYEVHQSTDDDTIFLFYERWTQKGDVDKHFKTPHFQAWEQKSANWISEPVQATFWNHIS